MLRALARFFGIRLPLVTGGGYVPIEAGSVKHPPQEGATVTWRRPTVLSVPILSDADGRAQRISLFLDVSSGVLWRRVGDGEWEKA